MATSTNAAGITYELPQTIVNSGSQTLIWSATSNQSWCTPGIASGSIAVGAAAQTFNILVNISALTSGMHSATVTITSNGGNFYIPVSITIP